jgi:hypothetical protein
LLPKKFTSTTYKAAQCKSEGSDGTTVVAEITNKSEDSFIAYTAVGSDSSPGRVARQFDFVLVGT